jgi:hypothetical protein
MVHVTPAFGFGDPYVDAMPFSGPVYGIDFTLEAAAKEIPVKVDTTVTPITTPTRLSLKWIAIAFPLLCL